MITGLSITNQVLQSKQWPKVTTIEGTRALTTEKVLQAINHVGLMLGRFIYWRFLHTRNQVVTVGEYKTGTVTVTLNSPIVTGTTTVWGPEMAGRLFKTTGFEEIYAIKIVNSPTNLELTLPYNGASGGTKSYRIAQDRYPLPDDFDSELAFLQFSDQLKIDLVPPEQFDDLRIRHTGGTSGLHTDDPQFATIEVDPAGRQSIVFDPVPRDQRMIGFSYYRMLEKLERDDDLWPFPLYVEPVILDGALHYVSRDASADERTTLQLQEFFTNRSELAGLTRMTDPRAHFQPDTGLRRRAWAWRRVHHRVRPGIEDEWELGAPRPLG